MRKLLFITFLSIAIACQAQRSGDTLSVSLDDVVMMAKERSIASKQAYTVRETKYWEWKTYKSNYQPQLSLHGIAPSYTKSFIPVLQPNGTIYFQPVNNNNSSLNLNFSQTIDKMGISKKPREKA